jgi:hypothetical protein
MSADYEFVLKKLRLSREEFEALMALPPVPHRHYAVERSIYARYPLLSFFRQPVAFVTSRLNRR